MEKNKNKLPAKNSYENEASDEAHSKLRSFFVEEIKDIYWAEKHLVKFLPKMQKTAANEELHNAFADHLMQTKDHVAGLNRCLRFLEKKYRQKNVKRWKGLLKKRKQL